MILATAIRFYYKLRHLPPDWVVIAGMFLVGFGLFVFAIWLTTRRRRTLTDREMDEKLEQARKEMRDEVTTIIETQLKEKGEKSGVDTFPEPTTLPVVDSLASSLLPLQREAILLSMRLLSFIEA
ncbi:MAG: hypothetical protein WBE38_21845 [Terracidiphilus sp.]